MRVHRAMLALTLLCCASASILAQDKMAMTVNDLLELHRGTASFDLTTAKVFRMPSLIFNSGCAGSSRDGRFRSPA